MNDARVVELVEEVANRLNSGRSPKYLTAIQVGEMAGWRCAAMAWKRTREDPTFPRPIKIGQRCTRWNADEVAAYLARHRVAEAA